MKKLLVINSSLQGSEGNSSKLSASFVDSLAQVTSIDVTHLDLNAENLPHLTANEMAAWQTAEAERTPQQIELASYSERYINLIREADYIVMGVPMYNFDSPSVLKAFFDRIARAGITFSYTENGPVGLMKDKKVFVLAARGGKYEGTAMDTQSAYLRNFLAFLGMDNIEFAYAEGLAMGEESVSQSFSLFNEKISELIKNLED
ncbi:FMN-dependent NADH-azoreductase [Brumicola blandensis]|uniref:FMN dependent NADH:quinone oxidoreductase n=1 Tax=Brumicola blandensis TaxID=3075611 RepID=A0AAW8R195_9ALTE|nr:NAD(P)H-dependent oxidoreductase [Alteromonas sp. W409]MDT0581610.1 NAD(P)H-dependent oxidoreductase [Alteromonas sp. W409]